MANHKKSENGFSLIEGLIGLGIFFFAMTLGLQNFLRVNELQKFVKDRSVVTDLEGDIRRAITNNSSLSKTFVKNRSLSTCLQNDGRNCPKGLRSARLWLTDDREVTGRYSVTGQACEGDDCLIEVKSQFEGLCLSASACDTIRHLLVFYQIRVDGAVFKQGQIKREFKSSDVSDDNRTCGVDQFGRTKLAYFIRPSEISCTELPPIDRTVSGINPGECQQGQELLVGFDAAGAPICQAIKFSQINR